jgi:allantoinase
MSFDLVVRGTLVLPHATVPDGWIGVSGGRIAAIDVGTPPQSAALHDAGQAFVMPGIVDGQTHATSAAGLSGLRSTTRSAVAGGVTTLVDMPYDNPDPLNTHDRLVAKIEAISRESVADVALYATVAPLQGTAEMVLLAESGVAAFKLSSFESHPVRFPRIPADQILDILAASVQLGLPVGLHNEDQEIVRAATAALRAKGLQTPPFHAPSRPVAAELAATASFLALGLATGAHAHIVHISSPIVFALVRQFQTMGARCTAETCAHYLHFDAARDIERLGALMKVNPPIRENVLDGVWQALADGSIDFVSSDHSSWPIDTKLTDSIFDAGAGIAGIETLVPSFYTDLVAREAFPERALVRYLAERPADFFGLSRKGRLAVGADADIIVLSPSSYVFRAAENHDELNWSPYDGETFAARVTATFVRGVLVWDGQDVVGVPGHGRFVARG